MGVVDVKFGVFYELQLPKPWGPDDEYHLLNALDQRWTVRNAASRSPG